MATQGREASLTDPVEIDRALRAEADQILAGGLHDALASYGAVHVVGSYALELMVWRDLDIHLVPQSLDLGDFFELGRRIAEILAPHRMQFRDERLVRSDGLPVGLYWGVYMGDERAGAWKLDVWATNESGLERVQAYCRNIHRRLSLETRSVILAIKAECWQRHEYRKLYGSADIYEAVLDHGVRDLTGFWQFLERRM